MSRLHTWGRRRALGRWPQCLLAQSPIPLWAHPTRALTNGEAPELCFASTQSAAPIPSRTHLIPPRANLIPSSFLESSKNARRLSSLSRGIGETLRFLESTKNGRRLSSLSRGNGDVPTAADTPEPCAVSSHSDEHLTELTQTDTTSNGHPEERHGESHVEAEERPHPTDEPSGSGEGYAAVDTSGLFRSGHTHASRDEASLSAMEKHLLSLIRFRGGPMSVAEYMEQVLTHPVTGYYMREDVFGSAGDFVTSPDVSQMFGELLGVWVMCVWEQLGRPNPFRLVELGPGRGALMADLLRSSRKFGEFSGALGEVSLVEVSPRLREVQRAAVGRAADLCRAAQQEPISRVAEQPPTSKAAQQQSMSNAAEQQRISRAAEHCRLQDLQSGNSAGDSGLVPADGSVGGAGESQGRAGQKEEDFLGVPIRWYSSFDEIPTGVPFILIAHEFFDALPIHQFQRTARGWCEKLVDVAETPVVDSGKIHGRPKVGFRFVLSPGPTAATTLALRPRLSWAPREEAQSCEQVEVSPGGVRLVLDIARRVAADKGAALIVDYGKDGLVSDSLQAIRRHQFVGVLDGPGTADISAHVDFAALKHAVNASGVDAAAHGPITQSSFLGQLGINFRLEALLSNATDEQAEALQLAYWRLVGDGEPPWLEGENDPGAIVPGSAESEDDAQAESGVRQEEEKEGEVSLEGRHLQSSETEGTGGKGPAEQPKVVGMGVQYKAICIVPKSVGTAVCFQ